MGHVTHCQHCYRAISVTGMAFDTLTLIALIISCLVCRSTLGELLQAVFADALSGTFDDNLPASRTVLCHRW